LNGAPRGRFAWCPLEVIGLTRTSHTDIESTPVQAALNPRELGTIELFEPFIEGLPGLEDFDYIWLLTWLGQLEASGERPPLRQIPFLLRPQRRSVGIFAMRGPRRVNPIGLSLVRLLEVSGRHIRFAGVDMVDETPVIDLKPYVTRFDRPAGNPRCGWFDTVTMPDGATPATLGRHVEEGEPP
jgi:tRNA (adenine37-N6)-methyltransferase